MIRSLEERERYAREKYDSAKLAKSETKDQIRDALLCLEEALDAKPTHVAALQLKSSLLGKLKMYKAAVQVISFAIQIETLNNDLHKQSTLYELRGSFFTRIREFDAALLDYNKAAQLDPENATLLYDIGNVYFLSGNYSVAPFFFTASLSENLSSKLSQTHRCKAYMLLGCCRLSTKEYSLAITALSKSIEVTDSAAVHNLQGVSLFLSGDKQRASDEFQRALELDPAVSAYHCNRGVCCFLLKNTEDALMNFSNAILNHPSRDEVLLWYRGVAQLVCDALSQAHVDLDESISLSPLPEFLLTKALVYFAEGNFSACQTFAKEALDASCGDGGKNMVEYRATFLLGVLAHTEERWYDALDCYLAAVKGDSSLRCAYYLVGLVYFKLKNYDVAIKYFDICISISPEIPLYYLHKGVAQVLSGNPYGGLQAFKTLQHDKQLPYDIVCYVRSRALLELNQHEEALEWVNQAIELESAQHQYYLSRAEILFNLDRFEACVEDIQSVERLNDKVGEAYYLKGRAYQARGLFSEALEAFNKARDCSPVLSDTPAFCYSVAVVLSCKLLWTDALDAINRAIRLSPTTKMNYLHERAKIYQVLRKTTLAVNDFTAVLEQQPNNFNALLRRAFALRDEGRYDEASLDLKRAQALEPGSHFEEFVRDHFFSAECFDLCMPGTEDPDPM